MADNIFLKATFKCPQCNHSFNVKHPLKACTATITCPQCKGKFAAKFDDVPADVLKKLAAQQAAAPEGNIFSSILMNPLFLMVIIFVIFYFFMIKPQQKQRKDKQDIRCPLSPAGGSQGQRGGPQVGDPVDPHGKDQENLAYQLSGGKPGQPVAAAGAGAVEGQ